MCVLRNHTLFIYPWHMTEKLRSVFVASAIAIVATPLMKLWSVCKHSINQQMGIGWCALVHVITRHPKSG